jgi:hypothetical protein
MRRIEAGGSVLDLILDKAQRLEAKAAPEDRARLDQYFQSVRELEGRLQRNIEWENRPKPVVDYPQPKDIADDNQVIARSRLMFDLVRLALQTDSTRVVTLNLSTFSVVPHVPEVKNETHGPTHHGNEPEKIAELRKIEEAQMTAFGELLTAFSGVAETGGTLLDPHPDPLRQLPRQRELPQQPQPARHPRRRRLQTRRAPRLRRNEQHAPVQSLRDDAPGPRRRGGPFREQHGDAGQVGDLRDLADSRWHFARRVIAQERLPDPAPMKPSLLPE